MNAESKCNCQHCNGHIAFPSEMAGQSINCPHCQLDTLLFIPPVTVASKPPIHEKNQNNSAGLIIMPIALLFIVVIVLVAGKTNNQTQSAPSNLKPAAGAFGWKLGDKLPTEQKGEVKDGTYSFTPKEATPPFEEYELRLTDDGTIYCIAATGFTHGYGESDSYKNALISLLSEKYGKRPKGQDFSLGVGEDFYFGTDEQTAHLNIYKDELFKLEYSDRNLQSRAYHEDEARRKRDEDEKKAAMAKGL